MKKQFLLLALLAPLFMQTNVEAMDALKDQSEISMARMYTLVREKFADDSVATTLSSQDVGRAFDDLKRDTSGHPKFKGLSLGRFLAGADGDTLHNYLATLKAKVERGENLTDVERKKGIAVIALINKADSDFREDTKNARKRFNELTFDVPLLRALGLLNR